MARCWNRIETLSQNQEDSHVC
ncbi:MAG: zinc finger domain-containing protein [Phycisphaerae bacterium]